MSSFELGNSERSIIGLSSIPNNYDYDESTYEFDIKKENDGHTAVVRQIKDKSTVLDVGCASGILGYILKTYKGCTIDGIEYDEEAYKVAKKKGYYRDINNFSVTDLEDKNYKIFMSKKNKYDYIVFADVLEHLIDPWNVIYTFSKMLKKNGKIIVCIPNIAHIDIIKNLFDGNFNYNRFGILDSTHLRFFTIKSFYDMINNINKEYKTNLKVNLVEQVKIKPDYFDKLNLSDLCLDDNYLNQLLVLQNVFTIELSDKTVRNNYSKTYNNNMEKVIADLNKLKELDSIVKENKELKYKVDSLLNSRSWRITKPLRAIKRIIVGPKK